MHDHSAAVNAAEDAEIELDIQIYGLSVECFDLPTIEDALRATRRPHGTVRLTTARRVRDAGMDVIPTRSDPHATLRVFKPLDEAAWLCLQQVFDPPVANRYARGRSR